MASIPLPGGHNIPLGPSLPDLAKDAAKNVFEDGFRTLNGWFQDLQREEVKWIMKLIVHPLRPKHGSWEQYLYGNALGLAPMLSIAACFITLMIAAFYNKRMFNAGWAIGMAVLIGGLGPLYFWLCDYLVGAGDQFAALGPSINTPTGNAGNSFLQIPEIANLLGSIFGLIFVSASGGVLVLLFIAYEILIVGIKFAGLIILSLSAFAKHPQQITNLLFTMIIVTMLLGRGVATWTLKAGEFVQQNVQYGNESLVKTVILVATFSIAVYLQWILAKQMYKTWMIVTGQTDGESNVRGKVETSSEERQARVQEFHAEHAQMLAPIPGTTGSAVSSYDSGESRDAWVRDAGLAFAQTDVGFAKEGPLAELPASTSKKNSQPPGSEDQR